MRNPSCHPSTFAFKLTSFVERGGAEQNSLGGSHDTTCATSSQRSIQQPDPWRSASAIFGSGDARVPRLNDIAAASQ